MEIWKRTNLGYGRTDKNDVKKMADFSPQICVCTVYPMLLSGQTYLISFSVFRVCLKVITRVFPVRGQKT